MENYKQANPVKISQRPTAIYIDGVDITQGQCINNSFQVARKNPEVEIVEGIILLVSHNSEGTALAHMWNKFGEVHFDVTEEKIWSGNSENKTREVRYAFVNTYPSNAFNSGETFEFSEDTRENVKRLNEQLKSMDKDLKPEQG
jgi:hypothetical protein